MSNSKSRWIIFLPGDKYDNNQQPQAYGCNQYIQNDEAEVQWLDGRTSKSQCKIQLQAWNTVCRIKHKI